ncbi:MAG TPA: hypothetical protein VI451_07970 [Anaerolineales bacterium]|nr:hypothetical protein [Anaerolineales bacterium]
MKITAAKITKLLNTLEDTPRRIQTCTRRVGSPLLEQPPAATPSSAKSGTWQHTKPDIVTKSKRF